MSLNSMEEKTPSLGVIAADHVGVLRPEAPEANPVPESSPRGDSQPEDRDLENELRDTANRIRQRTAQCVLENGRDLLRWRDRLRYGQFRQWVEAECALSMRGAELAMMVAKYAETSDKGEIISHLPATIQYRIAAPSVPEPVRDQILNSFAEGQRLKVYEVNQLIRAATGKPPQHVREGGAVGPAGSKSAVPEESLGMVGEGEPHPPSATPVDSPTEETVEAGTASKPAAPSSSMISLNRLLTTTKDPEKQDHIKQIYTIVRHLSQPTRGNLISHLAKLGDLSAAKLADCLL